MNKLTKWMDERKRSSFILMLIVGAYLYYSIYKMFQGLETLETSYTPVYIFMGVFAVGGTVLFILGLIALIGGHYKEKFELSDLVSAEPESGHIVAFDVDISAEEAADVFELMDRRRQDAQPDPREAFDGLHVRVLLSPALRPVACRFAISIP